VLILDMIEVLPPMGKYKYDTWRILLVKCYIDNYVRLRSCIQNVNNNWCRWFQDRTDPTGSPRSQVLADDENRLVSSSP
jgi:hypothetical protein